MKTPKQKAEELVEKYQQSPIVQYTHYAGGQAEFSKLNDMEAVYCAKIAVDEIIETFIDIDPKLSFWQEVKNELNKMS